MATAAAELFRYVERLRAAAARPAPIGSCTWSKSASAASAWAACLGEVPRVIADVAAANRCSRAWSTSPPRCGRWRSLEQAFGLAVAPTRRALTAARSR